MKIPAGSRRRSAWVAAGSALVLAAAVTVAWRAGASSSDRLPGDGPQGQPATATAVVAKRNVTATSPVPGTLGYAGSYAVLGKGSGTLTWVPSAGQVIRPGQVLYRTNDGSPVVLLDGSVPDWRAMSAGITGRDVGELNHDLVDLGDANRSDIVLTGWDYYSWETTCGVQRLEEHAGVSGPSGNLSRGQVVFEPEALRVSRVTGRLGGQASGPVLSTTSDRHVVTIALSTSQESEVTAGDAVTVTLPDDASTAGKISSVGRVASGPAGNATIPVTVTLTHPSAAGTLDQAPVTVNITAATAHDVLVVPVTALLAVAPARYVVEVAGQGNARRYVPVTPGIVDDADGLVQVTGALAPGERVVVAAT